MRYEPWLVLKWLSWQRKLMDRFSFNQQIIEPLLTEITPVAGAAALLLKHPIGDVYFLLALAHGAQFKGRPDDLLQWYFLFSMDLTAIPILEREIELDCDSEISALVLHGKLAVALFETGPVALRAYPCDPVCSAIVCTILPARAARTDRVGPAKNILEALGGAVAIWRQIAEANVQIADGSPGDVALALTECLADAIREPPYFPLLYAAVDFREGKSDSRGTWKANALAHNCYLLLNRSELANDYVCGMFRAGKSAVHVDQGPQESKGLPSAIASVCDDVVQQLAACAQTGAVVYIRRNVPCSHSCEVASETGRFERDRKDAESNWSLLRDTLSYLRREFAESALVTAWIGKSADSCDRGSVFPVGFVPGLQIHVLGPAADHPDIAGLQQTLTSTDGSLTARVVALKAAASESSTKVENHLARTVKSLLNRGARAIRGADPFPGPYILDFNNGNDLVIRAENGRERIIMRQRSQSLWEFLYLLCRSHESNKGRVTEGQITALAGRKHADGHGCDTDTSSGDGERDGQAGRIVDQFKKTLRNDPKCPVDPTKLFKNIRGAGWIFDADSGSTYKRLLLSARTVESDDVDDFDSNRRLGQRRRGRPNRRED
jgi:hypothetical protein